MFYLNSADEDYDTFMHSLKEVYHNCFYLKTVRTTKQIRKAWLTNECFEIIRKKNSLFLKFIKTKKPDDFKTFKKYLNFVSKFLRKAKKTYVENIFSRSRNDVIWRERNKLLSRGSRQAEKLELLIADRIIQGVDLANSFNTYFTTLVPSLNTNGSKQFLGPPNRYSAFFEPTTPSEFYSLFMSLKNSTARDIDDLQIKLLKFVLDLLVPVLCHIFNLSLTICAFPKNMQNASVTVLFKYGNQNEFGNY